MLRLLALRSVKRESLNVKGFGGRIVDIPTFTFHVLPFTALENDVGGLFQHPAREAGWLADGRKERFQLHRETDVPADLEPARHNDG